jgi:Transposase DDE domain
MGASHDPSGYGAGKKIKGRKRHICVDTQGLLINFAITPADEQDRDMIAPMLAIAKRRCPTLALAVADGG